MNIGLVFAKILVKEGIMRKKQTFIVLDVETTGLDVYKERMIEFAGVKLVGDKITDSFETLINPEQPIRYSSYLIHNISQEMVEDAPKLAEVMPKILDFIGDYPIVAHNAIFDYNFLNHASKIVYGKDLTNRTIDSQALYKEVFPDEISHGLESLMNRMNVEYSTRHRAMADAVGLAKSFPKLMKLYEQRFNWQLSQCDKVPYLFERYLRIQNAIQVMQAELLDLKSVFKVYFENGGEDVVASTGETLVYTSKTGYTYDFDKIRPCIDDIAGISKAVKLNAGLIDRMISGKSLENDLKEKLKEARAGFSENKIVNVIKPCKTGSEKEEHVVK